MTASLHSSFPRCGIPKTSGRELPWRPQKPAQPSRSRWPRTWAEQTRPDFPFVVSAGLPGPGLIIWN